LNSKNQSRYISPVKWILEVIKTRFGKVWSIMQSQKARAVSQLARADQIVASDKIIEFEIAKQAFEKGGCSSATNRLPNLAADDWLDWTALGALFVAVALIPVFGVILIR
jgi:hypothetical protein